VIRNERLPLLHWVHDVLGTGHWTERLAARHRPDLLVCNSHYSAECAQSLFPGVEHVVLYPPCDVAARPAESRQAIRDDYETAPEATVIVQVGRAEPLKGHRVLLAALAELRDDPRWTCWQVGAPQTAAERAYWNSVAALTREHGLERRVRFVGAQPHVMPVLHAADVYCQPNVGPEAFGVTFVEAMGAGLPVVTSNIGAAPEVLSGTGNILVPAGDAEALADALRKLLDDPARRREIGAHGIERAGTLTDPDTAHRVLIKTLERVSSPTRAA
jgi:glycosyltransferase involved in cell wall biosynthesis